MKSLHILYRKKPDKASIYAGLQAFYEKISWPPKVLSAGNFRVYHTDCSGLIYGQSFQKPAQLLG